MFVGDGWAQLEHTIMWEAGHTTAVGGPHDDAIQRPKPFLRLLTDQRHGRSPQRSTGAGATIYTLLNAATARPYPSINLSIKRLTSAATGVLLLLLGQERLAQPGIDAASPPARAARHCSRLALRVACVDANVCVEFGIDVGWWRV